MAGPSYPSKLQHALSLNGDKQSCKGATSIFFSTAFAIWNCRNDTTYNSSRAYQTKIKLYLKELLQASFSRVDKPFLLDIYSCSAIFYQLIFSLSSDFGSCSVFYLFLVQWPLWALLLGLLAFCFLLFSLIPFAFQQKKKTKKKVW